MTLAEGLVRNEDGVVRCWWGGGEQLEYRAYHDDEWGLPVTDDVRLFEKLALEGFQAGLSWLTILRKREAFRSAFADFDFHEVARFGERDVERLLGDASIVRHRGKIESTVNNARRALELVEGEGSLAAFVWSFEPAPEDRPGRMTQEALHALAHTDASRAHAQERDRRGWT
jgi:DNA-3-methyladenine glycosylase I